MLKLDSKAIEHKLNKCFRRGEWLSLEDFGLIETDPYNNMNLEHWIYWVKIKEATSKTRRPIGFYTALQWQMGVDLGKLIWRLQQW